jgi:hypothetical protein
MMKEVVETKVALEVYPVVKHGFYYMSFSASSTLKSGCGC